MCIIIFVLRLLSCVYSEWVTLSETSILDNFHIIIFFILNLCIRIYLTSMGTGYLAFDPSVCALVKSGSVSDGTQFHIRKMRLWCCEPRALMFSDSWVFHEQVFWICVFLLEMAYSVAVVMGLVSSTPWSKFITVSLMLMLFHETYCPSLILICPSFCWFCTALIEWV